MSAKYANLNNHISSDKNAANGEFMSPKKICVSSRSSKRRERTLPRDSRLTSAWRSLC